MTGTEKAIQKATEGGYEEFFDATKNLNKSKEKILLDPLFWSSLGKVCKWEEKWKSHSQVSMFEKVWQYMWHCFIDNLILGKSSDEFFDELLK